MLLFAVLFIVWFAATWFVLSLLEGAGRGFSVTEAAQPWPYREILVIALVVALFGAAVVCGLIALAAEIIAAVQR